MLVGVFSRNISDNVDVLDNFADIGVEINVAVVVVDSENIHSYVLT